jgi:hypothetical protein
MMPFRRQCPIVFIETPQAFAISTVVSIQDSGSIGVIVVV